MTFTTTQRSPLTRRPLAASRHCATRPFHVLDASVLRFSPLAWLKLAYLCHAGETEVGGFGISAVDDLLYVEQVETLLQGTTPASIEFSDSSVADHFDRFADRGVTPARCGRIWIHTHPGSSPNPSSVDEATFERVFGPCDWAIMFILSRTGQTYARLRFSAGPGGQQLLPVAVDWSAWPSFLEEQGQVLPELIRQWRHEYDSNVFDVGRLGRPAGEAKGMLSPDFGLDPFDVEREDADSEMKALITAGWEIEAIEGFRSWREVRHG